MAGMVSITIEFFRDVSPPDLSKLAHAIEEFVSTDPTARMLDPRCFTIVGPQDCVLDWEEQKGITAIK